MDPDLHGSAFIFIPGSGSRREKFKEKTEIMKGNWSLMYVNLDLIHGFLLLRNLLCFVFFNSRQLFIR